MKIIINFLSSFYLSLYKLKILTKCDSSHFWRERKTALHLTQLCGHYIAYIKNNFFVVNSLLQMDRIINSPF